MIEISNLRELLFWASGWLPVGLFVFILKDRKSVV